MIKLITSFFNRSKDLIYNYLLIIYKNFTFLNVLSIVFIVFVLYLAFVDIKFDLNQLVAFFISLIISGVITSFILNKFKFSKYFIIRILQKIVMYSILIFTIVYIFDMSTSVFCDGVDDNTDSRNKIIEVNNFTTTNECNNEQYVDKIDKHFVAPSVNEEFIHSSLQDLLLSLITLNTISLWMCLLVIISLVYKFILPSELTLRWLNNILPEHYVIKIKTVLIRVIDLHKKTNVIYIFFILSIILICNGFSVYFMNELYNNLGVFCIDHLNFKK